MWPESIVLDAQDVIERYTQRGIKLVTAESCTGGLIAGALTEISGSSAVVERGFVTYSNEAKAEMLGVLESDIAEHGAVSERVASQMAMGALKQSHADVAVSVTGVAGPTGGSADKPVGTVCFGLARTGQPVKTERIVFSGQDRFGVRLATIRHALFLIRSAL